MSPYNHYVIMRTHRWPYGPRFDSFEFLFRKRLNLIFLNLQGRQQDAEEFLGCVLNGAHEEMETAIRVVADPNGASPGVNGGGGDAQRMETKAKPAIPNGDVKTPEVMPVTRPVESALILPRIRLLTRITQISVSTPL